MNGVESLLLDTNVLVYAHDRNEPVKGPKAKVLLAQIGAAGRPLVSAQTISEYYWNVTRKLRPPLNHDEATAEVQHLGKFTRVIPISWELLILQRYLLGIICSNFL